MCLIFLIYTNLPFPGVNLHAFVLLKFLRSNAAFRVVDAGLDFDKISEYP